jgi:hypothetical protein
MTLATPFDLTGALAATLRFSAKWDIEASYDYTQVLASSDGVNFTALCGNYTSAGVNSQPAGQPVFDGTQNDWVEEAMDLGEFIGEERVWIRFRFASDGSVEEDGFYFDDLSVEVINSTPSSTNELTGIANNLSVYPNPFDQFITARMQLITQVDQLDVQVTNSLGQRVKSTQFNDLSAGAQEMNLPTSGLSAGIYYLEFLVDGQSIGSKRVVKMK